MADEPNAAPATTATATTTTTTSSAGRQSSQNSFFSDLGLPSTLTQLPGHLRVQHTCEQRGSGRLAWTLRLAAPEGYPLALHEFLERVELDVVPADTTPRAADDPPSQATTDAGTGSETETLAGPTFVSREHESDGPVSVSIRVVFAPGYGKASDQPLTGVHPVALAAGADGTASAGAETRIRVPPMRMQTSLLMSMADRLGNLKPVTTRVTHFDGSHYEERVSDMQAPAPE